MLNEAAPEGRSGMGTGGDGAGETGSFGQEAAAPAAMPALRVLILEDQESDAVLMVRALRKAGYLVSWNRVDSEQDFISALRGDEFDVVLSDYNLPSFNARRALAAFQQMRIDVPFIIVTGSLGEEQAVDLIKMGATDYLIKDRLGRIGGAVAAALEQKRLRDETRQALERARDSEERLRRIAENLPDVIYRMHFNPHMSFDYLSPAVEVVTGYPAADLYREPHIVQSIFRPEDIDRLAVQLRLPRFFEQPILLRAKRKDERVFWLELRNAPVFDAEGNIFAFEGVARDVTERVLRDREREAIMAVGSALRDTMTRAEMLPVLLQQVSELAGSSGAAVGMAANAGMHPAVARVEASAGAWKGWQGASLELSDAMAARVLGEGRSYLADGPQLRKALPAAGGGLDGMRELICVPLKTKDEVLGLLWVGTSQEMAEEARVNRLRLIEAMGDIAAGALNRARLYEETQHRLQHLTALRTIDRAITSSLDLHLTLNVLLDQLMGQNGVSGADVLLLEPYSHHLRYAGGRGFRARRVEENAHRVGDSLAGRVTLDRRMLAIENLTAYPVENAQRSWLLSEGFHAYLGLPLIAKGDLLGVLEILRFTAGPFEPASLEFVEALAGQVAIAINNAEMFEKLQRSNNDVMQAYDATIEGWSRALETRELETRGHTQRVVRWTTLLGKAMGVSDADLVHVRRGALLHDIGKMALPDEVLLKPGPLTEAERELMQRHPVYAFEWLSPIIYLNPAMEIPYCHHEHWDGAGYPRGLFGVQIPLSARIFSVIDSFDALQSHRPYRAPWPREKALEHIHAGAGSQFDPQVVEVFLALEEAGRFV